MTDSMFGLYSVCGLLMGPEETFSTTHEQSQNDAMASAINTIFITTLIDLISK